MINDFVREMMRLIHIPLQIKLETFGLHIDWLIEDQPLASDQSFA
jgi:hypothetical protein